jgi:transposase
MDVSTQQGDTSKMNVKLKEDYLKMRFGEIYDRYSQKELDTQAAADILGISVRRFLRKRQRYDEDGFDDHFDRRLGHRPSNRAADREVELLTKLYAEKYQGFTVKHFYGFAKLHPSMTRSYNWCRQTLQQAGLVAKSSRGGPHRQRRMRKPMEGMMLHQDGSTHAWIPELGHSIDLIVTMDDATSEVTSGFFVAQEGTMSSLQGIRETIRKKGVFCTFYTDRGSHYAHTPEAGGKVDKNNVTQVGRALRQLNIRHIHAYSPQARGRSERMFGTLQGRLPKELALHGITTLEDANRYLREEYWPRHNQEFSVSPKDAASAYIPWVHHDSLEEILCVKEDRVVGHDNTVRYEGMILQIPPQANRHHYVKAEVEVRKYLDHTLGIFYGHQCLGRYDQIGNLMSEDMGVKAVA